MKQWSFITLLLLLAQYAGAQTTENYAVELMADVQYAPPKITLTWKPLPGSATSYLLYRKAKTAVGWGGSIASLTATDSSYTDTNVVADSAYEYKISATVITTATWQATGYIYAGIKAKPIHNRGGLVLLVDSTFTDSCSVAIATLMRDLRGDGWQIMRHDVGRSLTDTGVKNIIKQDYNTHPNCAAVLILGHIAVPYSGDLNPDGHPDHLGAWPADIYYGDLVSVWTDATINDASSSYAANQNIPGDGKWDNSVFSAGAQLQVSRIDFYNMPAFNKTEVEMMNGYLYKDHLYKMDSITMRHKALISDNFGAFSGEAFAANGWRNFSPLVGRGNIAAIPFISSLNDSTYQWAYGCGGGTFTSAAGIGSTTNFVTTQVNGIFTLLFGSYFGDWNVQNNFLRAPLCADVPALTSCWAGRPNWYMHHMALGENIGYSAKLMHNSVTLYPPSNYGAYGVHVALMGDLSLRTDYIQPVGNISITTVPNHGATLNWIASPNPLVIGYYVYRSDSMWGNYARISNQLSATTYKDTVGTNGLKYYMVRPVKLQTTPSGSYYNLGVGVTDTASVSFPPVLSVGHITTSISDILVYPNPATEVVHFSVASDAPCTATLYVTDITGKVLAATEQQLHNGNNTISLSVKDWETGIYTIAVTTGDKRVTRQWVKQ